MTHKDLRTHVRRLSDAMSFLKADDTVGIATSISGLYRCDFSCTRCGCCYVPLDPKERLAIFVEDAKCQSSWLRTRRYATAGDAYENRRFKSFFLMNLLQRISHSQDRPRILQRRNHKTQIRMRTMTRIGDGHFHVGFEAEGVAMRRGAL